jgi:hypothetical protein
LELSDALGRGRVSQPVERLLVAGRELVGCEGGTTFAFERSVEPLVVPADHAEQMPGKVAATPASACGPPPLVSAPAANDMADRIDSLAVESEHYVAMHTRSHWAYFS